jgi:hypothetical protein
MKSPSRLVVSGRFFSTKTSAMFQKQQVKDQSAGVYSEDFAPIKRANINAAESNKQLNPATSIAYREKFENRHVGVGGKAEAEMLKSLNFKV